MGAADDRSHRRTELFLVRMRIEEASIGNGQMEWKGKVQRVTDGETHRFDDAQDLVRLLGEMATRQRASSTGSEKIGK